MGSGKINVLDAHVANLIAAGEVVDRPASVIKELLENAIDAEATEVEVEIRNGGISFMRVGDNGMGMSREDLAICVLRHATSKIASAADLDGIETLGFRGEALAAISSVSKMRIITRQKDSDTGLILTATGGTVTDISETGAKVGTTLIVEELFGNVPARRKFLKKNVTEAIAIAAVVEKIALSRPDIAIKLISDGNVKYKTSGDGSLNNAVYAVLGRDVARKLTPVTGLNGGIEISGFIGTPEFVRPNRNYENVFINGRYVKSKTVMSALEQAYESYIPSDKFPACVLNMFIHPAYVDVNVHPAKLEVKFSNDKAVFDAVYCAVRNTLKSGLKRPDILTEPQSVSAHERESLSPFVPVYDRSDSESRPTAEQIKLDALPNMNEKNEIIRDYSSIKLGTVAAPDGSRSVLIRNTAEDVANMEAAVKAQSAPPEVRKTETEAAPVQQSEKPQPEAEPEQGKEEQKPKLPFYRILGVSFNAYIFVEVGDRVLVIDKHAAHERIIFEKMKQNMAGNKDGIQVLLIPLKIKLTPAEQSAVLEYCEKIEAVGFTLAFDNNCVLNVSGIPASLSADSAMSMLIEMAGKLSEGTGSVELSRENFYEKALYQASCKAAMKAGMEDSPENVKWLVESLLAIPDIKYCPHGRPVAFELGKNEIEKMFRRS